MVKCNRFCLKNTTFFGEKMEFKNTKKFLIELASIRLDCKIHAINNERKEYGNNEHYWKYGNNKIKTKPKYHMLSNREICPSNPPLIGQIRKGKINKKNPHLFTPTTLIDIYNNCKFSPYDSAEGLNNDETIKFRARNMMYKSYDEIFFGNYSEQNILQTFIQTALILDILYEEYDENLWRIVLGYIPLNILFERMKMNINDVKKIYQILIRDNWELLMTGIFRATERLYFGTGDWAIDWENYKSFSLEIKHFIEFYNENFPVEFEGQNRLIKIECALTEFYNKVLKEKFKQFVNEHKSFEYQNLESIIFIKKTMQEEQKNMIDGGVLEDLKLRAFPWEDNFLSTLEDKNKKDEFHDEQTELLHTTRVINKIDDLLEELIVYQCRHENDDHWGGNALGYIKKYQKGKEILDYFQNGDLDGLRSLIEERIKFNSEFQILNEKMYIKKHPNSWAAIRERKLWEKIEKSRARNKK